MPGYGFARKVAAAALGGAVLFTVTGCGLLGDDGGKPAAIVIPSKDALTTESSPPTLSESTSVSRPQRSYTIAPGDSYRAVIDDAPHVGVGDFHLGATTPTGDRADNLSGVHFSTPDRSVVCSTGNNGADALVCSSSEVRGTATPPAGTPAGCDWSRDLVVLNSDSLSAGACANLYPVLYRSHILEFGTALSADSFSCLSDVDGLYCLESASDRGFALTRSGYREIQGNDRAPVALRGTASSTDTTSPSPTR
ncbi:hypothetical protein [Gordonia sp. FQ]|uniref:hypothetical protein n=1 Tax=Gordonia sp. FQ TaxID=3446634 RepID=UPI003F82C5B8